MKTVCIFLACSTLFAPLLYWTTPGLAATENAVEQWATFEASFQGLEKGNPFGDVELSAVFRQGTKTIPVTGFYDGGGTYRIRFMPETVGEWHYQTRSNRPELDGKTGSLTATAPSVKNHGPVRVRDVTRLAYADGTPYREIGTTCYAWIHQSPELQEQTLKTLADSPFNKIRMCLFPKWYVYNKREPLLYPYVGTAPATWDTARFNPAFFQHLEKRVAELRDLEIQADVILFHPYDEGHWGFDRMSAPSDDRYLRYAVARLASYRNVWWSLANEWDLMQAKKPEDWERFGQLIHANDPYGHPCSIHNCRKVFDPKRPWMTHVSLQNDRPDDAPSRVRQYQKPLIYDECRYEGNIPNSWGSITPQRMTASFWLALVGGAYCGHGETYKHPKDVLWWSHGGVLHGQSPARIAFFKTVFDAAPAAAAALTKEKNTWGVEGEYYLIYLWDRQPASLPVVLPEKTAFKAEVIDTWAMTIATLSGTVSGRIEIPLPSKPYQAIRLTAIRNGK